MFKGFFTVQLLLSVVGMRHAPEHIEYSGHKQQREDAFHNAAYPVISSHLYFLLRMISQMTHGKMPAA